MDLLRVRKLQDNIDDADCKYLQFKEMIDMKINYFYMKAANPPYVKERRF